MRNLLTKHGIPTSTARDASNFLSDAPESTILAFNREFNLTMTDDDALSASRFAADAIFRGAESVDKVAGYVSKMMTGMGEKAATAYVSILIVGVPVVDTETVTVSPVVPDDEYANFAPIPVVRGRRGRKRLGNSAFCKAINAIETAPKGVGREGILDCIIAQGIKESSAVVYLWRYNKGERE